MKTTKVEIVIPPEIAVLRLTLNEKAALAHITKNPTCTNKALAEIVGMSERGAEAMLHRLRKLGHIRSVGKGRARRIEVLLHVEHTAKCGIQQNEKTHTNCEIEQPTLAVMKREPSVQDFAELHLTLFDNCMEQGAYKAARRHLEIIRARVEQDSMLSPDTKSTMIVSLTAMENRCFAIEAGAEIARNLPGAVQRELALTLGLASPEKLAQFRRKIEANGELVDAFQTLTLPPSNTAG